MGVPGGSTAKRFLLESLGWLLVVAGVAALVLPGPGLLLLFGGLALLSQQYDWAERRLQPIKVRALQGAAEGVETWLRVAVSVLCAVWVIGLGVLWMLGPDVPSWWPVDDRWWLFGGPWTGVTLVLSGLLALVLIAYSYRRFHGKPEALAKVKQEAGGGRPEPDREHHAPGPQGR